MDAALNEPGGADAHGRTRASARSAGFRPSRTRPSRTTPRRRSPRAARPIASSSRRSSRGRRTRPPKPRPAGGTPRRSRSSATGSRRRRRGGDCVLLRLLPARAAAERLGWTELAAEARAALTLPPVAFWAPGAFVVHEAESAIAPERWRLLLGARLPRSADIEVRESSRGAARRGSFWVCVCPLTRALPPSPPTPLPLLPVCSLSRSRQLEEALHTTVRDAQLLGGAEPLIQLAELVTIEAAVSVRPHELADELQQLDGGQIAHLESQKRGASSDAVDEVERTRPPRATRWPRREGARADGRAERAARPRATGEPRKPSAGRSRAPALRGRGEPARATDEQPRRRRGAGRARPRLTTTRSIPPPRSRGTPRRAGARARRRAGRPDDEKAALARRVGERSLASRAAADESMLQLTEDARVALEGKAELEEQLSKRAETMRQLEAEVNAARAELEAEREATARAWQASHDDDREVGEARGRGRDGTRKGGGTRGRARGNGRSRARGRGRAREAAARASEAEGLRQRWPSSRTSSPRRAPSGRHPRPNPMLNQATGSRRTRSRPRSRPGGGAQPTGRRGCRREDSEPVGAAGKPAPKVSSASKRPSNSRARRARQARSRSKR